MKNAKEKALPKSDEIDNKFILTYILTRVFVNLLTNSVSLE